MKKLLYMYKFTDKYWIYAILCPIVMVAEAVLELQIPNEIGELINYLESTSSATLEIKEIILRGLVILGFSLASLTCGVLGGITASIASSGFALNLKAGLFRKIESFSFENIDKYNSSSLITRMTTDSNWVQNSFQMSIRMLFRSPAIFVYAIIMAKRISPELSFVFLYAIPVIVIGLLVIFFTTHPYMKKGIKKLDNLNELVEENVRGIRVVKSFTLEEQQILKFEENNNEIYKTFRKAHFIINLNGPLMTISINAVMIVLMILGSKLIGSGNSTMLSGDLYKLISYAVQILSSLMMLSMIFAMFIISAPSRNRIYEVLHEVPTIKNNENPIYEVKDGTVEFNNVFFKYNESSEKYVLNNINLKINSGETLGILGTTGSSKTTLVSMIARLYDASLGEVKVGGVNVKDYDIKTLRDAVAVVLQKNVLFSGTIKDNLKWGNENATDEEIVEACKISNAHEFILKREGQYDCMVEQGGSNVSGGQKQRICIARAILKNPKVLILDDSMSAVDTKTDKQIRDALKDYKKNITKIIVAQRCQSVMDADKIIIIDNGEITDIGTHDELLKNSKAYQEVYYSQNKEVK